MLPEKHPLLSQPVNIWCGEFLLTVTAKIAITKIIRKNEHNVWQWFFFVCLST
jgi:hypothetical protein